MTGLEKIITAIESQAEESAANIAADAERRAEKIKADGEKRADEAYDAYLEECRRVCAAEYENARSAAESEARRELLRSRSELIDRAEKAAADKIADMPDEEYFALILRLAEKCTRPSDGIISFNAADLKRLPQDLESRLNALDKTGRCKLKVSHSPADIDGGFLISFGDITENCSISAVMDAERDTARDAAAARLFVRRNGE